MTKFLSYLWLALLILYIISPLDAHPLFLDDLIASGVLFWLLYKKAKRKRQYEYHRAGDSSSGRSSRGTKSMPEAPLTPDKAYELLGVTPGAPMQEVKKAYKEKVAKCHPDKVNHLSPELQEKARELTLQLNTAMDIIQKQRSL